MSAPEVSVVVPVRDGGGRLRLLLAALRAQTLAPERFEILVGDDGSRDGATEGLDGVRVLPGPPRSSYAARNRAAGAARGAVLAFCDADCLPHPDWLAGGLAALAAGADLAAGEVRLLPPERPNAWALLDVDGGLDQRRWVAHGHALTANLFVRRATFEALGGFDERFPSGGDFDFAARAVAAGARLAAAPAAVVDHPACGDARTFLRRAWFRDRNWAARKQADGRRPTLAGVLGLVPVAGPLWTRARNGLPAGLQGGVRAGPGARLGALALLYLVLPYVSAAAHLRPGRPPEPPVDERRERAVEA